MMNDMKKIIFSLIAIMCISLSAFAQSKVTGTVVDELGEPVIGATVKVVGQPAGGVVTDLNGNYSIAVPNGGKVVISYIGYTSQTVKPGGKVQLKPDSQNLEEVVVVGYGVQKKAHLTGSVGTVAMDDISDLSNGSLANSLSGMVNGMSISGGNSRPGENARIQIRDVSDFGDIGVSQQQPLFVIDGYIYPNDVKVGNSSQNLGAEAFNNLDPNEVESISVLKDASAAVYGSRAANGVILVTTKKGKVGAPKISYSGQYGFTGAVSHPKMLDSYNWGRLYNIYQTVDSKSTTIDHKTDLFQADELQAMKNLNYDLLDKYWKTGATYKHGVNVSGGTDNVTYFGNVSYFTQDGNLGKLDYSRWNYRAGVDLKINKWIKANLAVNGDYGSHKTPLMKIGGSNNEDYNLLLTRPRYIPEEVNGYPIIAYGPSNGLKQNSQLYSFERLQNDGDFSESKSNNMTINTGVSLDLGFIKPLKGLGVKFSYAKSINNAKTNQYASSYTLFGMTDRTGSGAHLYTPVAGQEYEPFIAPSNFVARTVGNSNSTTDPGYLSRNMTRTDNYQMNFIATYARDFGSHSINALFSIEKSEMEMEYLYGEVTSPYEFTTWQSNSASGDKTTTFTRSEGATLSYIGRVNYAYANKYLFEFLLRSDSSPKFSPSKRWGTFPSFSAGWVISEESWFQNSVKWMNHLKLRASWGLTGRDNTNPWQWMTIYSQDAKNGVVIGTGASNNSSNAITINKENASVNTLVHWDKSYKLNVGLDFNVLDSRLGVAFDFYYNKNREMLLKKSQNIPGTVGTGSAAQNVGEMDNWGWELGLTWKDHIGKDFKYKVGINTSITDNKVLNMDWSTDYLYRQITYGHRSDVGVWGMQCIGMFRSYQDIDEFWATLQAAADKAGTTPSYLGKSKDQLRPGMLMYKDVRGPQQADGSYAPADGIVDRNLDQVQLSKRSSNPYGFTINLSAEYKRFSISTQINASWGAYSFVPASALQPGTSNNLGMEVNNMPSFWNPDNVFAYTDVYDASGNLIVAANRDAKYPSLGDYTVNSITSSFWRVNGTRIKVNNLTLAYALPTKLIQKIGVQSCRVNVTGQNLFSLYNPYPDHFIDPMTTYGTYPTLRKFTVGVNISF